MESLIENKRKGKEKKEIHGSTLESKQRCFISSHKPQMEFNSYTQNQNSSPFNHRYTIPLDLYETVHYYSI